MNVKIYKALFVAVTSIALLSGCVGQNALNGPGMIATGVSGAAAGAVANAVLGGDVLRGAMAGAAANVVGSVVNTAVTGAMNNR